MESMDMIDPVDRDLNRHLAEQELADSRGEAEDAKVEEWMADKAKVLEALESLAEEDLTDFLKIVAEAISNPNAEQTRKAEIRAIGWLEDGVREKLRELAPAAVEKDEQQAETDRAEDMAESREYYRTHGDL
jgi:hypothetical protein